jgi:hypothetical protein
MKFAYFSKIYHYTNLALNVAIVVLKSLHVQHVGIVDKRSPVA